MDPHVAGGQKVKENWEDIRTLARTGRIDDIPAKISVVHYRNLKAIGEDYMDCPEDLDAACGEWIYGPPGVGKSHRARAENPGAYIKAANTKWFTGYKGQEVVLMDDMELDAGYMAHNLKIWADKYCFPAESKGGGFTIRPKKIVVTSNYSIEEIFGVGTQVSLAILRRFKVTHITELAKFDTSPSLKRKAVASTHAVDQTFVPVPIAKYRKNADGDIVINSNRQPLIPYSPDAQNLDQFISVDQQQMEQDMEKYLAEMEVEQSRSDRLIAKHG